MVDMEENNTYIYLTILNYSIHHLEDSVTAGRHSNFQLYIR